MKKLSTIISRLERIQKSLQAFIDSSSIPVITSYVARHRLLAKHGMTNHYFQQHLKHLDIPSKLTPGEADRWDEQLKQYETFRLSDLAKEMRIPAIKVYTILKQAKLLAGKTAFYLLSRKPEFVKAIEDYIANPYRYKAHFLKALEQKGFYSVVATSKRLGVPVITLRYWLRTGSIPKPSHRHGCNSYYTQADLERIRKLKADYFDNRKKGSKR